MPGRVAVKVVKKTDSSQRSLLSFFESKSSLTLTTVNGDKIQEKEDTNSDIDNNKSISEGGGPSKKIKLDESKSCSDSFSVPLTPEQKKMINEKAITAKLLKQSQLLKVLDPQIGITWFSALENEYKKDYFRELSEFIVSERSRAIVYPPPNNIWEWTKQCSIRDVKVVILGQDPYHGPNQAHGLCFSVKKGIQSPPSLVNMYKELESDIPGFKAPNHGCLTGWTEQGVLLLNAVLTVEAGKANSHRDKGWEKVTDAVISWISTNLSSVVFLLWGAYAQKKAAVVNKAKHHLLSAPHPSPLSAHRGFLGCKHFSKCNELLKKSGKKPIDWSYLP